MPMFRRRPGPAVEAHQYRIGQPDPRGLCRCMNGVGAAGAHVHTIQGQAVLVQPGEWILPEPDGVHFYPVEPGVFAQRYESIDRPTP